MQFKIILHLKNSMKSWQFDTKVKLNHLDIKRPVSTSISYDHIFVPKHYMLEYIDVKHRQ